MDVALFKIPDPYVDENKKTDLYVLSGRLTLCNHTNTKTDPYMDNNV